MESSQHHVVCFGEVLWDLLAGKALPGGAPMNVAYHLRKLGTDPALITRIGPEEYGKNLVNLLANCNISTDFFDIDYEHTTGLVNAKMSNHNEVVYDIIYPSAWDFIEYKDEYKDLVKAAEFFVYGSLTSRSKVSRETLYQLLEIAQTKVLDINLRPPHFNLKHIKYLLQKTDILKMNIEELELITGWFSHFSNIEDRIKLLQSQFDIKTLIITMGKEGALILHDGTIYRHPGIQVTVADTIGSGDAFLAGFLHQLLNGSSLPVALAFASGIGAFIATQPGGCPSYEIAQLTEFLNLNSQKQPQIIHNN
jgi:fructokinase